MIPTITLALVLLLSACAPAPVVLIRQSNGQVTVLPSDWHSQGRP